MPPPSSLPAKCVGGSVPWSSVETAERRRLVDGAIVEPLLHRALRRSEVVAPTLANVDLSDSEQVVIMLPTSKTNPAGDQTELSRRFVGGCAGLRETQNLARRPRRGPPASSPPAGLPTHVIGFAGGWKVASMIICYEASVRLKSFRLAQGWRRRGSR